MADMFAETDGKSREKEEREQFLANIENFLVNGDSLILDRIFNRIDFDKIEDDVYRKLVIARELLGDHIGVMFYDVTTLYIEADKEDDLRKTGFSKEGRHKKTQIILGLLVSLNGYPLAYCIHEGNKYEGHTMMPVIKEFF